MERLNLQHAQSRESARALIAELHQHEKPYSREAMSQKRYLVKVNDPDLGWVEVETFTRHPFSVMAGQAMKRIAAGEYRHCNAPKKGGLYMQITRSPKAGHGEWNYETYRTYGAPE